MLEITDLGTMKKIMNEQENKQAYIRTWLVSSGIALVLVFILIAFLIGTGDSSFKYGTWRYYLLVDPQVRSFPIIGAERVDTTYEVTSEDGTKASMVIVSYIADKSTNDMGEAYQKVCNKLGYRFKPDESASQILNFTAKKPFDELSIELYPAKQGSKVRLIFLYGFAN